MILWAGDLFSNQIKCFLAIMYVLDDDGTRPEVTLQDTTRFVTALKRQLHRRFADQRGWYEEVFAVMR
jgi:hypothetical protein